MSDKKDAAAFISLRADSIAGLYQLHWGFNEKMKNEY